MKTILLVEDEDAIRLVARLVLSRQGYEVLAASTALQANELWRDHCGEIGLVITDNSLPDGSGIELVRRFEREKPDLKVIVASGVSHADLPWRYFQLTKPYNGQFLLAFVRGALNEPLPKAS